MIGASKVNRTTELDRIISCYSEIATLKEGGMPAPRTAVLYPTYACNHRCIGCDYNELNQTQHFLSESDFRDIVGQLIDIGIRGIEFCGGGEPTLHPSLPKIIDKLIEHNISFGFLTNGTNLTRELQLKLVKYGSYCRISLESASERMFNYYKRPINEKAGFKNVIRNIKNLVKLRNKYLSKTKLQISLKYAMGRNNYRDAVNAVVFADRLQLDSVQYKLIRNTPSELKDVKLINTLKRRIIEMADMHPNLRVSLNFKDSKLKTKCWLSPTQLIVDPFGDVYICCYYRHRSKGHLLGNMLKNKLKDIWYSQEHREKIANIKKSDCNKYNCRLHYYNELMQKLITDDTGKLSFI